ncbi:MAG TPA: amidohydrolase family protein [Pyrinomonadaceae bacterium]|nr:amidohydrolase family protein [Pyrinomonadaceae bacterium]
MIVDSDTHINEEIDAFERFLEAPYTSRRPVKVKDTFGLTRLVFEGRLYPETRLKQAHSKNIEGLRMGGIQAGAQDPKARLGDLDLEGIDIQLIYGSLGLALSALEDKDFAAAMSRACNNYYADFCSVNPERLRCMATLPLQDIPASVEEMRRAVKDLGLTGITLPPNVNGKNLDHPDFYPLYEEAQKLRLPIAIHWGNGAYLTAAGTERFNTHFMTHAVGHTFEQMIAVACIVCGGVAELFPKLRFAFLEAGCGWLPYWMERLHEHYERRTAEVPLMKKDPFEYIADGNCFFATEPDEKMLPAVINVMGDDLILFGSDYPHTDSKFPNSVKRVRDRTDISEESKNKILTKNGARFVGIETGKAEQEKIAKRS